MREKQRLTQKGFLALLSLSFLLSVAFPGFAAEGEARNELNSKKTDTFKLETIVFRLTPLEPKNNDDIPLFTLTNTAVYVPVSPQILKEAPKKPHRTESTLFTASLLTFTALNIADYVSTVKALQLPGLEEGNPIMRPFTKNILLFGAVKIGLTALDFYVLNNIHKKNKTLGWVLSIAGNFVMSYIVSNNIRKIQSVTRK